MSHSVVGERINELDIHPRLGIPLASPAQIPSEARPPSAFLPSHLCGAGVGA